MLALRSIFAERVALFAREELARSTTLIDAGLAVNSSAHRGMKARPDGTAPQVILALTIGLLTIVAVAPAYAYGCNKGYPGAYLSGGARLLISKFQLKQTEKRFAERQLQRERNLRLIKEKRYLKVDSPDCVQKFLTRRGLRVDLKKKPQIKKASAVMVGALSPCNV